MYMNIYHSTYYLYNKTLDHLKISKKYTMRSIRCWHATEWVKMRTEYFIMGWEDKVPPNPLQHEDYKTTLIYYAQKGSDNREEAYERCLDKYPREDMPKEMQAVFDRKSKKK
jgi:hypothetical protein